MNRKTRIKLCGLRRPEDVEIINEAVPDYAGFIIGFPKSFRSLTEEAVRELAMQVRPEIQRVGVFVDPPAELVVRLLKEQVIDLAQLHGEESPEEIRVIQRRSGCPVIKVFKVRSEQEIRQANESPAEYVLLDRGYGEGIPFDWSYLKGMHRDYFLAGGLGPDNVREAVERLHPFAVDMSSSLETERCKDPEKIRLVMKRLREA